MIPIYPDIKIEHPTRSTIIVYSQLRSKHKGIYYLHLFIDRFNRCTEALAVDSLHRKIYIWKQLGVVDPDAKCGLGDPVFEKDENQQSEKKRIRKLFSRPVKKNKP